MGPFNRCGSNAPARVYTVSGHTTGPYLLNAVAVKLVVVVPVGIDVLECAQSCDSAATAQLDICACGRGGSLSEIIMIKPKSE